MIMSNTKKPAAMLSRLRHKVEEAAAPEILSETSRAEPKRTSILTPSYKREMENENRRVTCFIPWDQLGDLEKIMREASPFLEPLTLTQLIEMMYCQIRQNKQFEQRLMAETPDVLLSRKFKKTSILLKAEIDDYLCRTLIKPGTKQSPYKATTKFIVWIVKTWSWTKPLIRFRHECSQETR